MYIYDTAHYYGSIHDGRSNILFYYISSATMAKTVQSCSGLAISDDSCSIF